MDTARGFVRPKHPRRGSMSSSASRLEDILPADCLPGILLAGEFARHTTVYPSTATASPEKSDRTAHGGSCPKSRGLSLAADLTAYPFAG
jgi:hypothetical protein